MQLTVYPQHRLADLLPRFGALVHLLHGGTRPGRRSGVAEGPLRDIWLTVYPDRRRSPLVKVMMEFLVACIEGEPQLRR